MTAQIVEFIRRGAGQPKRQLSLVEKVPPEPMSRNCPPTDEEMAKRRFWARRRLGITIELYRAAFGSRELAWALANAAADELQLIEADNETA